MEKDAKLLELYLAANAMLGTRRILQADPSVQEWVRLSMAVNALEEDIKECLRTRDAGHGTTLINCVPGYVPRRVRC